MYDLITIGDSTIDTILAIDEATLHCDVNRDNCLLCLHYAEKIPIKTSFQSVGGNAANVSVGAQTLGFATAIVSEVGDDINGHVIRDELDCLGINTKFVRCLPNQQTRYSVILEFKGERTVLSYYAERRYVLPELPATKWVFYSSLGASFEKLQRELLAHLKKHPNIHLALNPGTYQLRKGLAAIHSILPHVSLLIVNKQEAMRLAGKKMDAPALCRALHKRGVSTVAITDGTKGSYASDGTACYYLPAYPIKPISRTGAGDAYTSGFLAATILGKSIPEAMQWGTANAGGVIQKMGAQKGLLTRRQIENMIRRYKKIVPKLV
ncbi:MAG: hypothetical protein A3C90_03050 [Candidatus Magasanikbacteria bacterium RIFCSPHIGHO2_02_FULL_51_14]|uniref:Carbohydrate kinase PfkB domain-containing protein n=1 Tax=Candidatus Magasanikbacteria bacterium RIFCSPHIGHO2_02_FULL_51_14 TaxID=1798683 RepID=A0A1F6MQZ5_9BACT|nr:MAG: hypothetical protein A3C90_03050 [Candidatus Magasanikbacteria bacterium RIFCSPHIGHO2_02_FULL_51_14]